MQIKLTPATVIFCAWNLGACASSSTVSPSFDTGIRDTAQDTFRQDVSNPFVDAYVPPRDNGVVIVDSGPRTDTSQVFDSNVGDGATCTADFLEPRNNATLAMSLHELGREDEQTFTMTIHTPDDVDWFRFTVNDGAFFDPDFRVTILDAPSGTDLGLAVYGECVQPGDNDMSCLAASGMPIDSTIPGTLIGMGCGSTNPGSNEFIAMHFRCSGAFQDEDGTLHVRVFQQRPANMCFSYRLEVREFAG